ncbi:hypothetical protein WG899_06025 [Paucibacter sp. AS339]|uniref:hypothetical protein n=1 Tax=Paucibacter hankyongi TaxID=3133434 RepID=UPI00309E4132
MSSEHSDYLSRIVSVLRDEDAGQTLSGEEVQRVCDTLNTLGKAEVVALSRLLADRTQTVASTAEVDLRERVYSLTNSAVGESQSQVFDSLCKQVFVVFGDDATDAEILANSATPDLVRYLTKALRSFHNRALSGASPRKRNDALARAMLSAAPIGGKNRLKEMEQAIIQAARNASAATRRSAEHTAANQGLQPQAERTRRSAEKAALAAALEVFHPIEIGAKNAEGWDEKCRREAERKVRKLLAEECLIRESDPK